MDRLPSNDRDHAAGMTPDWHSASADVAARRPASGQDRSALNVQAVPEAAARESWDIEAIEAVASLMLALVPGGEPDANQWMMLAASGIRDLMRASVPTVGPAVGVSVWHIESAMTDSPPGSAWIPLASGVSGYASGSIATRIDEDLGRGGASDDLPRGWGPRSGSPRSGAWVLDDIMSPAAFALTRYAAFRRETRLGSFCRLCTPETSERAGRWIIVQVDLPEVASPDRAGTGPAAAPADAAATIERVRMLLRALGPSIARAYAQQVGRTMARRSAMLARTSTSQRRIFELMIAGYRERAIAEKIHRSIHTVHDHIKSIYAAMGVASRFELLQLWQGVLPYQHPAHMLPGEANPEMKIHTWVTAADERARQASLRPPSIRATPA